MKGIGNFGVSQCVVKGNHQLKGASVKKYTIKFLFYKIINTFIVQA